MTKPIAKQSPDFSRIPPACRRWLGGCLLLALMACASPAARLHRQADQQGFQTLELPVPGFVLQAFQYLPANSFQRLHVYLEGDGRPWERGRMPSSEPTTHDSVVLPLMAIDAAPSLYLARPCYNGHAADVGCHPALWTQARYGQIVVDAMTAALRAFCERHQVRELVLIGHSGGGSLAMLLAERLPQSRAIITLAGNYDIDVWADHHGYWRLKDSLNPARQIDRGLPEWHILAREDRIVPPALFEQTLRQRKNSRVHLIDGDHHRGWLGVWPSVLAELP